MANFIEEDAAAAPAQSAPVSANPQFVVAGNPQEDLKRQEAIDPTEVEEVTEEEQAQYNDFVSRAIAMISDNRKQEGGGPSPSETVLNVMNNSSFTVAEALAEGTVATVMILHDAAKGNGKPWSPDVMFHAADEVIAGLYLLGSASGVFQGTPDHSWAMTGPEGEEGPVGPPDPGLEGMANPDPAAAQADPAAAPISEGDFTQEEYMMMGEARMLAVEKFGARLQKSGQITEKEQAEAQAFWKSQIEKEVETGQVEDDMFAQMDLDSIRAQISKRTA